MKQLDEKLNEIEILITELLVEEKFPAFVQMKKEITFAREIRDKNKLSVMKQKLGLCIRLLMEAPPRDKTKGLILLNKLDHVYKSIN